MREIKFRAWDTTEKKMHHELSLMFVNDLNGVFEGLNECGCIVMQYTGLKDRNGKEIYEGDIVRHGLFKQDYKMVVRYWEESASFVFGDRRTKFTFGEVHVKYLQVIGNIHDNPELLEV